MDILACAKSYESLLNIEYEFVIAKKGVKISLKIIFHKAHFYQKIKHRIEKLAGLEDFFDSDDTVFRYNPNTNIFSLIKAEYLLEKYSNETKLFAFIDKNPDGNYFCRSFFPQEKYDYSIGQTKWTLLSKKKRIKSTDEVLVLFERA